MCLHGDSESVSLAVKIHSCHLFMLLGFLSSECPYFFFFCPMCLMSCFRNNCQMQYFELHCIFSCIALYSFRSYYDSDPVYKANFSMWYQVREGIVFAGGYGVLLKILSYVYWTVLMSFFKITWPFVSRYNSIPLVSVSLPVLYYFDYYNFV